MIDPGFWAGRRVLLTGHTGFKGAWLAAWLERLDADTTGFALAPDTVPSLFAILEPWPRLTSKLGDIRDPEAVAAAVAAADPEIVIHMAAQALVRRSYRQPVETIATNVMGAVHLMQALRECRNLKAVVVVTSDKTYAKADDGAPFKEGDCLGGDDPYSASKAAAEIVTAAFARSFLEGEGIAVATARGGNALGGGDWAVDRLVTDYWIAVTRRQPLILRYPGAKRPWQHVLDLLAGYLLYAERLATDPDGLPRALNFGPEAAGQITTAELADRLLRAVPGTAGWREADGEAPPETIALNLDASLAFEALGWRPALSTDDMVAWTAGWYLSLAAGADMRIITTDQIADYMDRA